MRKFFFACVLPLFAGCLAAGPRPEAHRALSAPAPPPVGVVFVANGAGNSRSVSQNLGQALAETSTPLQVETFAWSRGYRRYVADQTDHNNHLVQGARLAAQAAAYRRAYPERRVYFVGHSAGCAVVLAAAELLPPDSVDRIILLAPSVCPTYDLRPALRTARCGIDSFNSSQDGVILGLGMRLFGTTEGDCAIAAGQDGFTPLTLQGSDAVLYAKLHQHPWHRIVGWSGHDGGHFGNNQAGYLRAYVLPLLVGKDQ